MSVLVFPGTQAQASNHSASGVLALLQEENSTLRAFALEQLNANIDEFWFQVSESIPLIEALYEDDTFEHRSLCALVLSKVFYHLEDLDEALAYALGANELVDVNGSDDYSKTVLACCVDTYTSLRKDAAKEGLKEDEVDGRLLVIVERLFEKCVEDGQFEQAVGLAVESHRLDMLEKALVRSTSSETTGAEPAGGLVQYVLKTTHKSITSKRYRDDILELVVNFVRGEDGSGNRAGAGASAATTKDLTSIVKCLLVLDRPSEAAEILLELMEGSDDDVLMAYQLGFDICEAENQSFSSSLRDILAKSRPAPVTTVTEPEMDTNNEKDKDKDGSGEAGGADGADGGEPNANSAMDTAEPQAAETVETVETTSEGRCRFRRFRRRRGRRGTTWVPVRIIGGCCRIGWISRKSIRRLRL